MFIYDFVWLDEVVEKIEREHRVYKEEVEEVFYNGPRYRKGPKGKHRGEDLYYAYGRTDSGRYLFVVFVYKTNKNALIVSARDMDDGERRLYARK